MIGAAGDAEYGCDTLVLGIGNLLWADEGFGVRAMEALHRDWNLGPKVRVLDGGTQGLYLLPFVEGCRRLLILDAVDYGLHPGALRVVRDGDVPAFMGAHKMSLHQTGFQEVLAVAGLKGWRPAGLVLIGVQPEVLEDYGGSLSTTVRARVPEAVATALGILRSWGLAPAPRRVPLADGEGVTLATLALDPYERGRPSAALACRIGDPRVLVRGNPEAA